MTRDPVWRMGVNEGKAAALSVYQGRTHDFCSTDCGATFEKAATGYATP